MPQRTHNSLVHVLLLWTAILSMVQAMFIIFYFTSGHHAVSEKSVDVAPESKTKEENKTHSTFPPDYGVLLGPGKMLSFQANDGNEATDDKGRIKWVTKWPDKRPVSEGEVLTVKKDGYYFLNLQVTLCSCKENHTVSLKWNGRTLLQGRTNTESCSTGLLGKVEVLSAGGTLEVTIDPNMCVDTKAYLTHLDIIYMLKP
ncbi:hypothetical protein JOB18_009072 [Solea senegalensis]|uniref:TNF family profile domain-containing protein n=1 Tax=Solea senegalensis TaxID=28829 RepID=A0AAV6RJF3_SOLSE|nr:hypothetical protein JOB18_009072 [Solea senegalensis]